MSDGQLFLILAAVVIVVAIISAAAIDISRNRRCDCQEEDDE